LHSLRKRKEKLETCEAQRKGAREEADLLLTRLRTLADNYEDLSRASALLEANIQPLESRVARKEGQRRRIERLLNLALAALPVSDPRRVLAEAADICAQLVTVETEREEAILRIAELEQELGMEAQKLQVTERSALLRLDSEYDALEQRFTALEQELVQAKAAPEPASKSATKPGGIGLPMLTRYDPRISPFLSSTIEVRLTERERLTQTAPNTARY
jgi:chromosome segregation ATPase